MLFSIMIPVYNVENYFTECIESVLKQTIDDYEIILINDGSTDSSGLICDKYKIKYPDKITVIHQNNIGLLLTRRKALSIAKGDYCVFIDSDDFIKPNMLEELRNIIYKEYPDVIMFQLLRYYSKDKIYPHKSLLFKESGILSLNDKKTVYEAMLKHCISNTIFSKVVKRSCMDIYKDYSEYGYVSSGEDLLQSLHFLTHCDRIYYSLEPYYYYRCTPKSMTNKFNKSIFVSLKNVNLAIEEYLPIWQLDNGDSLIARHFFEDIWDIFVLFIRSNEKIFSKEAYNFFRNIAIDEYFTIKYNKLSNTNINIIKKYAIFLIYKQRKYQMRFLMIVMKLYYILKSFI